MKKFSSLLALAIVLVLLSALLVPVSAQDDEVPGPGEGNPVIAANLGGDVASMNPFDVPDTASAAVVGRIFPTFLGLDPDTANVAPNVDGAMVTGWEVSEDGGSVIFTLRDDWTWSDGVPMTAGDVEYSWDVLEALIAENATNYSYIADSVADVIAIDDYTVEFVLTFPHCSAFVNISAFPVAPEHLYSARFPNALDMIGSELNLSDPEVTAGPWAFANFRPGEQVTLVADQNYQDSAAGYVVPAGWVYRNVADTTLIVEQFLAGDLTYASITTDRFDELREIAAGGGAILDERPAAGNLAIFLNLADPTNPQPGLDEEGNAIEQGFHPILGDVRVRQALMYGLDFEAFDLAVYNGNGIQLATHWLPTNWAYDAEAVPFYPYDPDQAVALLEEAGWVMGDDGFRVAQGAPNAEDGTRLAFTLVTNAGNAEREAGLLVLDDMWAQIGIDIDAQAIDFNVAVDQLLSQTYDAVLIGWNFGLPADPVQDMRVTFSPSNDLPGGGFNTPSYNNARVNEILVAADDPAQTEGCNQDIQRELALEAYGILRDELPWLWLSTRTVMTALQPGLGNFNPSLVTPLNDEDSWVVAD
jgi:peptide/nickel transport system substrate-binding protein